MRVALFVTCLVDGLFPDPDGAQTASATLDLMAKNQNELIDKVAALEAAAPGPFFP